MSSSSHVTIKPSRRVASRGGKNISTIDAGTSSTPASTIIKTTLHVTPHVAVNRESMIAVAAYHRAERRGFEPGHELEDWLAAEMELDQRLVGEGRIY